MSNATHTGPGAQDLPPSPAEHPAPDGATVRQAAGTANEHPAVVPIPAQHEDAALAGVRAALWAFQEGLPHGSEAWARAAMALAVLELPLVELEAHGPLHALQKLPDGARKRPPGLTCPRIDGVKHLVELSMRGRTPKRLEKVHGILESLRSDHVRLRDLGAVGLLASRGLKAVVEDALARVHDQGLAGEPMRPGPALKRALERVP